MSRFSCHALFAAALMLLSGSVFSLVLTPANSTVNIGDEIRFSLTGDYSELQSFALNIDYDPTVLMPVFSDIDADFIPDNLDDIGAGSGLEGHDDRFNYFVDDFAGLFGLSFSNFLVDNVGSGIDQEIAFFTFKAVGVGVSTIDLNGISDPSGICDEAIDSCLIEASTDPNNPDVRINRPIVLSAQVSVVSSQSTVPLPGILYLMFAGLVAGALAWRRS